MRERSAKADHKAIDKLLIPDYGDWNVRVASNQLDLCYTPKGKLAGQVNAQNRCDILQKKGVVWGHSVRL